jgi:hypothetical protein
MLNQGEERPLGYYSLHWCFQALNLFVEIGVFADEGVHKEGFPTPRGMYSIRWRAYVTFFLSSRGIGHSARRRRDRENRGPKQESRFTKRVTIIFSIWNKYVTNNGTRVPLTRLPEYTAGLHCCLRFQYDDIEGKRSNVRSRQKLHGKIG